MNAEASQLPLFLGECERAPRDRSSVRGEQRQAIVRVVDYYAFPRVRADHRRRVGFTRDVSAQGMCLGVEVAEPVGSLLRVIVRGVDGRPTLDSIARVSWCAPDHEGFLWLGLRVEGEARRAQRRARSGAGADLVAIA